MESDMRILITGAKGFIGKNLCVHLKSLGYTELLEYDIDTGAEQLDAYTSRCDFVYHLAGVNRPKDPKDFEQNIDLTRALISYLDKNENKAPVLMSSSTQAQLNNPYGNSKKEAEKLLFEHSVKTGAEAYIYRLPGVFGKWCRPNYNSVVATFCDAAATGKPIRIDDADAAITLVYIDDVIEEFINALHCQVNRTGDYCSVGRTHRITIGELADRIISFRDSRKTLGVIDISNTLTFQLYSTYLSYLQENDFIYPLVAHSDERGCYAEFLKSEAGGQVSVNIAKPGATKGGHWHHTKTEKILVIGGSGVIRFQKVGEDKVISCRVSADKLEVVDIPVGYAHAITNTGKEDLIMVIWANQIYDPQHPDTYPAQIGKGVLDA